MLVRANGLELCPRGGAPPHRGVSVPRLSPNLAAVQLRPSLTAAITLQGCWPVRRARVISGAGLPRGRVRGGLMGTLRPALGLESALVAIPVKDLAVQERVASPAFHAHTVMGFPRARTCLPTAVFPDQYLTADSLVGMA